MQTLGARIAAPGEFTERAYLNGRMDLTRAEAVNDLIRAHTRYAKGAAVSQLEGKLAAKAAEIHRAVLDLLAELEAAIDHSDLEEEFVSGDKIRASIGSIRKQIHSLISTSASGRMAREGIRAAIVGTPNSGKSSLMNYLLQKDRVIVSDIPGTTRDTVEEELSIRGVSVRLIDTAGVRKTADRLENLGIERSRKAIDEADIRIVVFDASRPLIIEDRELFRSLPDKKNITVLNKIDLSQKTSADQIKKDLGTDVLPISAKTGSGMEELEEALYDFYFSFGYNPETDVLVTNARQEGLLKKADSALTSALKALEDGLSEEFTASGLRQARAAIEEITGKTSDDEVLSRIFSQFCVGK